MKLRLAPGPLSLLLASAYLLAAATVGAQIPSVPDEHPPALFPGQPQHLADYGWDHLTPLQAGETERRELVSDPSFTGKVLKITNPAGTGGDSITVPLLTINAPPVTQDRYMVYGQVRYENVRGSGYLEMWSTFSDGRSFFTRTLSDGQNPMRIFNSTIENYRAFALPFDAKGSGGAPKSLKISLMLPPGVVYLKDLRLCQYTSPPLATPPDSTASAAIIDVRTKPTFADVPPNLLGKLVTIAAIQAAFFIGLQLLARQLWARTLVFGTAWTLIATGFVIIGMGLAGYLAGWATPLWIGLCVVGGLTCSFFGAAIRYFRRVYHEEEWRRMAALDT